MIHPLLQRISAHTSVDPQEAADILACFHERTFPRNELLLRMGETAHQLYFIVSGIGRKFYVDVTGREHTFDFCMEQDFTTDLESFSRKAPSASSIQTISKMGCYAISCSVIGGLMDRSPVFKGFILDLTEAFAISNIHRVQSLLTLSPEQRFTRLLETRPELLQRIPQRYIAQYLGVAPESLSRIRKRIYDLRKS